LRPKSDKFEEKYGKKSNFICIYQKKVVPLHGFPKMGYNTLNIALLEEFMQKGSISGQESGIIELYKNAISTYVEDDIEIDVLGNCISYIKANACTEGEHEPRKIMLVAHSDEVGLMISHIDENGYLYFQESGAVDSQILQGVEVDIEGKEGKWIRGVIGKKPIHFQKKQCEGNENKTEDLWIDIAATEIKDDKGNIVTTAKAWAEDHVELGTQVVFYRHMEESKQEGVYNGAGFDDKIGLYILVELAKRLKGKVLNSDIYLVASTQEELGGRGASVAAAKIKPDECIVVDVTHATDYPTVSIEQYGDIKLGGGPVLFSGPNINREIYQKLQNNAGKVKYQKEPLAKPTGTDANAIQITGEGIATAVVGIPCRYMHTPNERISMNDVEKAIDILEAYITTND
jgi:endoglucanase